ncbi:MAG TPA: ABC transporter permease, partial [Isosphaeraceae bacterium]|nr:ABC transporter permease [Isosphaeraceae bacterium]
AEPGSVRLSYWFDLAAILTVVRITVERQNRGRRLLILALLFSLPIVFAILTRRYQAAYRPDPVESVLVFGLIFSALVPLSALLFATGLVQDDLEEQTLTYFLIRPIPRWAVYLAKLLATFVVTMLRAVIFTMGTLVAVYWGEERLVRAILLQRAPIIAALLALSLGAYVAIFGGLSLWVRRTLVVGAVYIVVFEGVIANIDFVIREATVIYYIRVLSVRWLDRSGADWSIDPATAPSASTCLIVLLSATAVFALLGALTFGTREFRVKTPAGS